MVLTLTPEHPALGNGLVLDGFNRLGSSGQTSVILALAILFAYLFLVALYEGWVIPVPVLLSVAVGVFAAFLGILYSELSVDLYARL